MKKTERNLFVSLIMVLVALFISIGVNIYQHYHFPHAGKMVCDTTVITKVVTTEVTDTAPTITHEKVIGYAPLSYIIPSHTDTASQASPYSFEDQEPQLPIVQREYSDSLYTAWVSGILLDSISPRLDSIRIKEHTVFQTITIERDLLRKKKRWHIGVTASYGYGFNSKKPEPFIGVGVTYSLFSF